MTDIYLFRHAHVDYGPGVPITGDNPLTPLGREMAARLADSCSDLALEHLWYSPMLRTRQTAQAILDRQPNLKRKQVSELEEASIRDMEGYAGEMPTDDIGTWTDAQFAYANRMMWDRVRAGWDTVVRQCLRREYKSVGVVSHGGPINIILRHILGQDTVRLRTCWIYLTWASTSCVRLSTGKDNWDHAIRFVNDHRYVEDIDPEPYEM